MKDTIIKNLAQYKKYLQKEGIQQLYLVGSFSRGEATKNSDIDLLFSLSKEHNFGIFTLMRVKQFLEKETGKSVDLVEENSVNKHLQSFLKQDKTLIF